MADIMKYERASFVAPLCPDEIPSQEFTALHHAFGFSTERRDNIKYVEPGVLLYVAGNFLVTLDLRQDPPTRGYVKGVDGGGIGAFVVHPTEPLVVVGEKGNDPNLYIFHYPSWELAHVLRKGAEQGYSTLSFSPDGEMLASVAEGPDYILSVWDWRRERVTLHTKAFGQDVFNVKFSLDDPGRIVTSGTGHIRFWKMARTFTGLKLQGDIGKFGKIELSDVDAFAELPDGKVLSSTESGALLVWEGNFIKYRLVRPGGGACHDAAVTYVELIRDPSSGRGVCFVSAGKDGKLCWWDFKTLDEAEIDLDRTTDFEMEPLHEVLVGDGLAIRTLLRGGSEKGKGHNAPHILIVDEKGGIWRVELSEAFKAKQAHRRTGQEQGYSVAVKSSCDQDDDDVTGESSGGAKKLFEFHAKGITAMDTSPLDHFVATGGEDGTVRCWDYVTRRQLFKESWGGKLPKGEAKRRYLEQKRVRAEQRRQRKEQEEEEAALLLAAAAEEEAAEKEKAAGGGEGESDPAVVEEESKSSGAAAATSALVVAVEDGNGSIGGNNLEPLSPMSPSSPTTGSPEPFSPNSPNSPSSPTFSEDGTNDGQTGSALVVVPPSPAVTSLRWAPLEVARDGRSVFVGFSDGVVRVLWRGSVTAAAGGEGGGEGEDGGGSLSVAARSSKFNMKWTREQVFKPHNDSVTSMAFSDTGTLFATGGKDGLVFLFMDARLMNAKTQARGGGGAAAGGGGARLAKKKSQRPPSAGGDKGTRHFEPLGFVATKPPPVDGEDKEDGGVVAFPTSLSFRPDGQALLVACSDGSAVELDLKMLLAAHSTPATTATATGATAGGEEGEAPAEDAAVVASSAQQPSDADGAAVASAEEEQSNSFELTLPTSWFRMARPITASAKKQSKGGSAGDASPTTSGGSGNADTFSDGDLSPKSPHSLAGSAVNAEDEDEEEEEELPLPPLAACSYLRNRQVAAQPTHGQEQLGHPFVLAFGGDLGGQLFECRTGDKSTGALEAFGMGQGPRATQKDQPRPPKANALHYSHSKQFLLCASDDGSVSVRQAGTHQTPLECCYLRLVSHDSAEGESSGGATAAALSFDNNFLLTAGKDGQLVVLRVKLGGLERLAIQGLDERKKRLTALKHSLKYVPPSERKQQQALSLESDKTAAAAVTADVVAAGDGEAPGEAGEGVATAVAGGASAASQALVVPVGGGEGVLSAPPAGFVAVASTFDAEAQKQPSTKVITKEAKDITDPKAYSILDAKIKTEEDERRAAAEVKKAKVLSEVKSLQEEFEALKLSNSLLPHELQLDQVEELLVDPEYAAILEEEGREMAEEVQRECAYDSEKSERRLCKLEERFLDPVATEASQLVSFDLTPLPTGGQEGSKEAAGTGVHGVITVCGFVVPRMQGALAEVLSAAKAKMRTEAWALARAEASVEGKGGGSAAGGTSVGLGGEDLEDEKSNDGLASLRGDGKKGVKMPLDQVRKLKRHERQAKLAALEGKRPGKNDDDPADLLAIETAEKTMGDYKLKASPEYEVPENVTITSDLKLRELVLFEEAMLRRRQHFNKKFFGLRQRKRQVAVAVTQAQQRVDKITHLLHDKGVDASGKQDPLKPSSSSSLLSQKNDSSSSSSSASSSSSMAEPSLVEPPSPKSPHYGKQTPHHTSGPHAPLSVPTLDASKEWPAARHLYTPLELAHFKEKRAESHSGLLGGQGVVSSEHVPPLTVVPGLVRGLDKTAKAAAHFHSGLGGHGGDATKRALAAYHKHNQHHIHHTHQASSGAPHAASSSAAHSASRTLACARALSALPLVHYLDHHHDPVSSLPAQVSSSVSSVSSSAEQPQTKSAAASALSAVGGSASQEAEGPAAAGVGLQSGLEVEEAWVRRVKLEAERAGLKERAQQQLEKFNEQLRSLRRERLLISADLAACEVKLLTNVQEYRLLKTFEVKDGSLAEKLEKCARDRGETAANTVETKIKIRGCKEELSRVKAAAAEVEKEFFGLVGTAHPFHSPLLKIFKRKIKRSKKKSGGEEGKSDGGDDEDSSEEEDEDEDDEEEDGEGGEEEEVDDSCPAGCDSGLHETVLMQRVKRLDSEDKAAELAKTSEEMEKLLLRLTSKEKQVEKDLVQTEGEIRKFQTEKQRAMDRLWVPVPLKISQLCCFEEDEEGEGGGVVTAAEGEGRDRRASSMAATENKLALATTGDHDDDDLGSLASSVNSAAMVVVTTGGGGAGSDPATTAGALTNAGGRGGNNLGQKRGSVYDMSDDDDFDAQGVDGTDDFALPSSLVSAMDMSTHALFPRDGLDRLKRRISELAREGKEETHNYTQLHKTKKDLLKARVVAESAIRQAEEKNVGLQMLRFGQVIDMGVVEAGDQGAAILAEASETVKAAERGNDRELNLLDKKQRRLKEALLQTTQENTELLSTIADLSGRQFQLEKELNGGGGGGGGGGGVAVGDSGPSARSEVEERNKLVALVKLQAKEVEALKAEINLLRRKGGHVYVPPMPPNGGGGGGGQQGMPQPPPM